jgi:magnesium transporter
MNETPDTPSQTILSRLDPLHRQDIENAEHSSYFFDREEYSLLILRLFTLDDEGLDGVSVPYAVFEEAAWQYDRPGREFHQLRERHLSVEKAIGEQLERSEQLIEKYIDEVDRLEDSLYNRKISPIFLDVWFDLKKDMTRMDRILERAEKALQQYLTRYKKEPEFPREEFINIIEHLQRYQRMAELNANKLDTLYSYYNSLKNDKINNNIYVLTILSGIFLPLNLVVGFFGMNTENLFFSGNPEGTLNVVSILGLMFVMLVVLFPLLRILEHYILRRLLGRFSLYNKLIDNITKLGQ